MRDRAEVVVVGAGIMGLSVAYHLAERGVRDVLVVDRGYLCGGASGRNGGGVRAQWSSEINVRLMLESVRMCREFAAKMKINVWFRQGGYLFLARTRELRATLEKSVALQNECGLPTRMLSAEEVRRVVPELDVSGVQAASYNPDDGVVFPWPFVWGYAQAASKLGVEVAPWHEVVGFDTTGSRIDGVRIRRAGPAGAHGAEVFAIATHRVVNAAGAWSPGVARMLGVELPNVPHRHEILLHGAAQAVAQAARGRPVRRPLLLAVDARRDCRRDRQRVRAAAASTRRARTPSSAGTRARSSRACPVLGEVKVLRQWAGCYDLTPDANPIVGPVEGVDDFFQASGFMGHGFMMAPVVGKRLAEAIAGDAVPEFDRWNLRRFKEGRLLSEGMIIG